MNPEYESNWTKGAYYERWNMNVFKPIERKEKMVKGDFIIGSIHKQTGAVSFAKNPSSHKNFINAKGEAERLAEMDKDKKFIVVEIKGICSVQNTVWE